MLVLSRYNEQSIMIGDDIEIRVIAAHSGKVTLGIQAPRQVPVHRKELFDRISKNPQADGAKHIRKAVHRAK
jgi:carbon storage regulator